MSTDELLHGLPGEVLVRQGLEDYQSGRHTIASCLVRIALPRLTRAGLLAAPELQCRRVPARPPDQSPEAELELYALLQKEPGDAYSRYNSLIRELVSFENALDHRLRAISLEK